MLKADELAIERLGPCSVPSPMRCEALRFVEEERRILATVDTLELSAFVTDAKRTGALGSLPGFEIGGPRERIFFRPEQTSCGIVTCGGLCPGLNDVIRSIVLTLARDYGVQRVLGFRYGYAGLVRPYAHPPLELTRERVARIHEDGGTVLGTSRGEQSVEAMVDTLVAEKIDILFTLGGDGTLRGASEIASVIRKRKLPIRVIGVPKTIDNDLMWIDRSFGFATAVAEARRAVSGAYAEASCHANGIGLVKLMGRHSGFIAAHATLANSDVSFCLVPEVPFRLEGERGLLRALEQRLKKHGHAVIVAAEGAGQDLFSQEPQARDASGNLKLRDIGARLKRSILRYFRDCFPPISLKYIDPSYIVRSLPANAFDSQFCLLLGQYAVHAGMAGRTDMVVGHWNQHYTHVPMRLATSGRKQLSPHSHLWQGVLSATGQPAQLF